MIWEHRRRSTPLTRVDCGRRTELEGCIDKVTPQRRDAEIPAIGLVQDVQNQRNDRLREQTSTHRMIQ
jgi:hypothetical protein